MDSTWTIASKRSSVIIKKKTKQKNVTFLFFPYHRILNFFFFFYYLDHGFQVEKILQRICDDRQKGGTRCPSQWIFNRGVKPRLFHFLFVFLSLNIFTPSLHTWPTYTHTLVAPLKTREKAIRIVTLVKMKPTTKFGLLSVSTLENTYTHTYTKRSVCVCVTTMDNKNK